MLRNLTLGCLKLIGELKQVHGMIKSVFYKDYSDSMKKLKINLETIVIIRHWPWKLKKKGNDRNKTKVFLKLGYQHNTVFMRKGAPYKVNLNFN